MRPRNGPWPTSPPSSARPAAGTTTTRSTPWPCGRSWAGRQGGWNYGPSPVNGDLSVSVMQIVAMRAANNAEIPVPADSINRAIKYLHDHANPGGGGFGY